MPQHNQQNLRFILIFQRRFEILLGKFRVFSEPPHDGLVMGGAGFAFHEVPILILVIFEVVQRPLDVRRLFSFIPGAKKQYTNSLEHRVIDPIAWPPIDP